MSDRVDRLSSALLSIGILPGERVALCLPDGIDFVAAFLGAIRVGIVPVALNTLLPATDYAHILDDSGARAAIVSDPQVERFEEAVSISQSPAILIVSGSSRRYDTIAGLTATMSVIARVHPSMAPDIAFWLYSSGSTGKPKGTPHRHSSSMRTAQLFGVDTFGMIESDVVFSAAKLFFAYGLGNSLTFPMAVGATTVLCPERITPDLVERVLGDHRVTIFCGVPTLYCAMLAAPSFPHRAMPALRRCLSADESLPEDIGEAWTARTGTEIIDGIGSTECFTSMFQTGPPPYATARPGALSQAMT